VWSAVLSRKLKPCDLAGDFEIVPGEEFVMLWAHGSVVTNNFLGVTYHGLNNRGSVSIALLAEEASTAAAGLQKFSNAAAAAVAVVAPEQPQQANDAEIADIVCAAMQGREVSSAEGTSAVTSVGQQGTADGAAAAAAVQASKYTPPPVTKNPDGTFSVEIKCPRSSIPAKETTYLVCYTLVPTNQ
jgi:hypothetical protein